MTSGVRLLMSCRSHPTSGLWKYASHRCHSCLVRPGEYRLTLHDESSLLSGYCLVYQCCDCLWYQVGFRRGQLRHFFAHPIAPDRVRRDVLRQARNLRFIQLRQPSIVPRTDGRVAAFLQGHTGDREKRCSCKSVAAAPNEDIS